MENETKHMLAMGERTELNGVETIAMAPLPANSGYAPGNIQGLLKRKTATYIDLKTSGGEAFGAKIYLLNYAFLFFWGFFLGTVGCYRFGGRCWNIYLGWYRNTSNAMACLRQREVR